MDALSLYELNRLVRRAVCEGVPDEVWVTGELAEGRTAANGHFYGELVEKNEVTDQVVARARIPGWAGQWRGLRQYFMDETGQDVRPGMSLMLLVAPTFHEQYGFSLNILDVQPQFTLGGQALKRRRILAQLDEDGILHDNQSLVLPTLVQRIAVVSAAQAAGWGDFHDQLLHNSAGLAFRVELFPAVMQGQHVEESVIAALCRIADEADRWDAVVIIRGGGASTDLSDFDSYPLAACIAQFPLPVITGIGHDRDETVLDYVAHTRLKTPTAVAAFLVERMGRELERVNQLAERIPGAALYALQLQHQRMDRTEMRLGYAAQNALQRQRHRLELLDHRLRALDPALPLRRGYAIVRRGGDIVAQGKGFKAGDIIEVEMQDVSLEATIKDVCPRE